MSDFCWGDADILIGQAIDFFWGGSYRLSGGGLQTFAGGGSTGFFKGGIYRLFLAGGGKRVTCCAGGGIHIHRRGKLQTFSGGRSRNEHTEIFILLNKIS
jgi:hypothetical protein